MNFRDRLFAEYCIPESLSIFGGDGLQTFPVADLDVLISTCVEELQSDVYVTEYTYAGSMGTQLPQDAFAVVSAKLNAGFQGNRQVRFTFDSSTKICWLRAYPSTITYRRLLRLDDLDSGKIRGDQLRYVKTYILWKMAEKEYSTLSPVVLDADNGSFNLSAIKEFAESRHTAFASMKDEIFIYTGGA